MEFDKALKQAISTGKVHLGIRECRKALKRGQVKLLIVSSNNPFTDITEVSVPVYNFSGNNTDLGRVCGKQFPVSVVTIVDEGSSPILSDELLKNKKETS
jgi:ribosomal protein L30E